MVLFVNIWQLDMRFNIFLRPFVRNKSFSKRQLEISVQSLYCNIIKMINIMKRSFSHCKFIGYPFAGGQPRKGVEKTPEWLFSQPWFQNISNTSSYNINFQRKHENTLYKDSNENIKYFIEYSELLAEQTQISLDQNNFTIVVGGDHS